MKKATILLFLLCTVSLGAQNRVFTVWGHSIEMVPVKGGIFYMGAQKSDPNAPNYDPQADDNEGPVHKVQVSDFWISKYPVSQGLWEAVTGFTPHNDGCITPTHCQTWYAPYIDDNEYPAYYLSYIDVRKFLSALNNHPEIKEQITFDFREGFYVPTEAQWEYAARGGAEAAYHVYAGSDNYEEVAWVAENCVEIPKMGQKMPNALGLYDMCGAMAEWCRDKYAAYDAYKLYVDPETVLVDPENSVGNYQVQRGGRFPRPAVHNRIAARSYANTDARLEYHGFRLVLQAPIPTETTGTPIVEEEQEGEIIVYSLDGRRVGTTKIPAGIYIVVRGTERKLTIF